MEFSDWLEQLKAGRFAFEELEEVLREHPSTTVRLSALGALTRQIDQDPRVPELLRSLAKVSDEEFIRAFSLRELLEHGRQDTELVELCWHNAIQGEVGIVRFSAWECLGEFMKLEAIPWERVANIATTEPDARNRQHAIELLIRRWTADPRTVSLLRHRAVNDENVSVRIASVRGLAIEGIDDPESLRLAEQLYQLNPSWDFRSNLMHQLAKSAPALSMWEFCRRIARNETDPGIRESAVQVLVAAWPKLPQTKELLHEILITEWDDSAISQTAFSGLIDHWKDDPETATLLHHLAKHGPEYGLAMDELAATWSHDRASWQLLCEIAQGTSKHQSPCAVRALSNGWAGDAETGRFLTDLVFDSHSEYVPETALRCLVEKWSFDAVAFLREKIEAAQEPWLRCCACCYLEGFEDDRVPDVLRNAIERDTDENVRAAALGVLVRKWWSISTEELLSRLANQDPNDNARKCAQQLRAFRKCASQTKSDVG